MVLETIFPHPSSPDTSPTVPPTAAVVSRTNPSLHAHTYATTEHFTHDCKHSLPEQHTGAKVYSQHRADAPQYTSASGRSLLSSRGINNNKLAAQRRGPRDCCSSSMEPRAHRVPALRAFRNICAVRLPLARAGPELPPTSVRRNSSRPLPYIRAERACAVTPRRMVTTRHTRADGDVTRTCTRRTTPPRDHGVVKQNRFLLRRTQIRPRFFFTIVFPLRRETTAVANSGQGARRASVF